MPRETVIASTNLGCPRPRCAQCRTSTERKPRLPGSSPHTFGLERDERSPAGGGGGPLRPLRTFRCGTLRSRGRTAEDCALRKSGRLSRVGGSSDRAARRSRFMKREPKEAPPWGSTTLTGPGSTRRIRACSSIRDRLKRQRGGRRSRSQSQSSGRSDRDPSVGSCRSRIASRPA